MAMTMLYRASRSRSRRLRWDRNGMDWTQDLDLVQRRRFRRAVQKVANLSQTFPDFFEKRFVRGRGRQRLHFFGALIDQVPLPKRRGAVGRVLVFDRSRANLKPAQPSAEADQMRQFLIAQLDHRLLHVLLRRDELLPNRRPITLF